MFRIIHAVVSILIFSLSLNVPVSAASSLYVEFEVPEYSINQTDGYDYIDIPGGGIVLEEEGRPRIPFYLYSIDYEESYRIQDVRLQGKSEPESNTGLNLPIVIQQWTITKSIEPKTGWYPDIDFEWNLTQNPDGSKILDIIVYPIKYNPEIKELLFYCHYSFVVDYILSDIEILSVNTSKPTYQCGEIIDINAEIANDGTEQELYLDIIIRLYGSGDFVDSLPIRQLKNVVGNSSFSAEWNSTGTPAGNYYIEMILTDTSGNMIDGKNSGFALSELAIKTETQTGSTAISPISTPSNWFKKPVILYIGISLAVILVLVLIFALSRKRKN